MKTTMYIVGLSCFCLAPCLTAWADEPIEIGSRLELFVDSYLIDNMAGVTRKLHSPEPKGPVISFDQAWEGAATGNVTVFDDGIPGGAPSYRMYYVGVAMHGTYAEYPNIYGPPVVCLAESRDGVHWTRPNLKIFTATFTDRNGEEFTVPEPNNIVWIGQGEYVNTSDNFVPFKDANPDCKPEARYKAIGRYLHLPDTAPPGPTTPATRGRPGPA